MNNKLTYPRTTTYTITHEYTGPYLGTMLYFTIKNVQYDSDPTDITDSILTPKNIAMTGSTFPQTPVYANIGGNNSSTLGWGDNGTSTTNGALSILAECAYL